MLVPVVVLVLLVVVLLLLPVVGSESGSTSTYYNLKVKLEAAIKSTITSSSTVLLVQVQQWLQCFPVSGPHCFRNSRPPSQLEVPLLKN